MLRIILGVNPSNRIRSRLAATRMLAKRSKSLGRSLVTKMFIVCSRGVSIYTRDENNPDGPLVLKRVEKVLVRLGHIFHLRIGGQLIRTTDALKDQTTVADVENQLMKMWKKIEAGGFIK